MINKITLDELASYINQHINGYEKELKFSVVESVAMMESSDESLSEKNIHDYIEAHLEASFKYILFKHIDDQGLTDAEVYKCAGVDRRLFSKIRSNKDYRPGKNTVIALALALKLSLDDALELLETLGYSLSLSEKFDLVIRYCFEKKIYDYMDVNEALTYFDEKLLVN